MSSVPPAKSTRVGALDSMIMVARQLDSRGFVSSQFDGMRRPSQEMTVRNVNGKAMPALAGKGSTGGGGAVASDELGAVLLFLGESRIGLEAAAAAGFVRTHRADDDQFFAFNQALGVHSEIGRAHV